MTGRKGGLALSLLLSVAGGLLLAGVFLAPGPVVGALLTPIAIVPWIVLLSRRGIGAPEWLVLPGAYLFALLASLELVGRSPVIGLLAPMAFIPFLLVFGCLIRRLPEWNWFPGYLVVPIAWVGTEWIRATYSPGSLEIFLLGHGVYSVTPFVQVADLVGVYGISFLAAAANSLVAWEIFGLLKGPRAGSEGRSLRLVLLGGPLLAAWIYGPLTLAAQVMEEGPRIFAVRLGSGWPPSRDPREVEKRYVEQTYRGVPRNVRADLIVWPEDAIPDVLLYDEEYLQDLAGLGNWFGCPILLGARAYSPRTPDTFRSVAAHITEAGAPARVYAQRRLLPAFQYAPLEMQLRRHRPRWAEVSRDAFADLIGDSPPLEPGHDLLTFDLSDELAFGGPLGLEVMSHRWCRGAKERGAAFLVSLGRRRLASAPLSRAVLMAATFRAIECRISILRVSEGGLTFLIDPAGRQIRIEEDPSRSMPAFRADIPVLAARPPGTTRGGEILGRFAAALCAALCGWVVIGSPAASRN